MERIKITVQTEKRLEAINNLSKAIYEVSRALRVGTYVSISKCHINTVPGSTGIIVDTEEDVTETIIAEDDES